MDKYPELEEFDGGDNAQGDFLSREKELLGDDNDFAQMSPPAEEIDSAEFETQYPPVEEQDVAPATAAEQPESAGSGAGSSAGSGASTPAPNAQTSQFIEEWKVKHQLEVERRDKASNEKQEEIRKKAQTAIDDFYANYNAKREEAVAKVDKEAEEFVARRDEQNQGSTWDKVSALISDVGKPAEGITPVDKTRFKELVTSLKGDPDAPGAAGY